MIFQSSFQGLIVSQEVIPSDSTSALEVRIPTHERLTKISQDERYNYRELKAELTLWDRFTIWLSKKLGDWVREDIVSLFLKITAGLAVFAALILFINQLSKGELRNAMMRRRNRTLLNLNFKTSIEQSSNLDELINKAIQKKNYGIAVRYLYQKSIQLLREGELINWKPDKTNHDFLFELGAHPAADLFDRLTYFYEYVDYGDFEVDEPRFITIQSVFSKFTEALQSK